MPYANYTSKEVAERGEVLYEKDIRPQVEAGQRGQFLVQDIETGDYEIAPDDVTATKRLLGRNPGAVVYGLRIEAEAAYILSWRFAVKEAFYA